MVFTMNLKLPVELVGKFTYVDCGSAGDSSNFLLEKFKDSYYVGFDPGLKDMLMPNGTSVYFPVAVSKETAQTEFHRTVNPNCSSFFQPNEEFLSQFTDEVRDFFKIKDTIVMQTVTLDEYLPKNDVTDIDFIELDTQGAELDILQGSESFLSSSIMGLRVEVEFAKMYQNQPLFGDVDAFLQRFGFQLFDLDRYHLKRASSLTDISSREQVVWGQAIYLRDFRTFSADPIRIKQKLLKLAVIASHYGFHSYAITILEHLLCTDGIIDSEEKKCLKDSLETYIYDLKNDPFLKWARYLDTPPLRRRLRQGWTTLSKLYDACRFLIERQRYFWKD